MEYVNVDVLYTNMITSSLAFFKGRKRSIVLKRMKICLMIIMIPEEKELKFLLEMLAVWPDGKEECPSSEC
ncbi:Protein of unknown function [Gryllus bimaculatus]|nr:Protein of unknown function [Gryllus bimaculatus]